MPKKKQHTLCYDDQITFMTQASLYQMVLCKLSTALQSFEATLVWRGGAKLLDRTRPQSCHGAHLQDVGLQHCTAGGRGWRSIPLPLAGAQVCARAPARTSPGVVRRHVVTGGHGSRGLWHVCRRIADLGGQAQGLQGCAVGQEALQLLQRPDIVTTQVASSSNC